MSMTNEFLERVQRHHPWPKHWAQASWCQHVLLEHAGMATEHWAQDYSTPSVRVTGVEYVVRQLSTELLGVHETAVPLTIVLAQRDETPWVFPTSGRTATACWSQLLGRLLSLSEQVLRMDCSTW